MMLVLRSINFQKMKKRIDWFCFLLGIAYLIVGIVFSIRGNDWFIIAINFLLGIMVLFKSYYQKK